MDYLLQWLRPRMQDTIPIYHIAAEAPFGGIRGALRCEILEGITQLAFWHTAVLANRKPPGPHPDTQPRCVAEYA